MSEYQDYNWGEGETCSHAYLYDDLQNLLDRNVNTKILDVGSGNGTIAKRLLGEGFDVYGTDASTTGIQIANKHNPGRFYCRIYLLKIYLWNYKT